MSQSALAGVLTEDDVQALTRLNAAYIDCVVTADADRFATILADDFVCSNPDGTLVDRDEFLRRTRSATRLQSMAIDDLRIRVIGSVGIIHARTTYVLGDGRQGAGRYTDVWALRGGTWLAVAAHVTRLA
ncbi:MAG: nuclear transport factor 2 family protein [Acidobacteria bacterium]|nr:nuclear transport factor 2 family protein [Acidobacteriota bacterium]